MSSQSASSTSISPSDATNGSAPDVTPDATVPQLAATVTAVPQSATAPPNPDASALNGDIMPGEASKGTASTTAPGPDDEQEEEDDCPDPNIDPQLYAEDRRMRAEGASRVDTLRVAVRTNKDKGEGAARQAKDERGAHFRVASKRDSALRADVGRPAG